MMLENNELIIYDELEADGSVCMAIDKSHGAFSAVWVNKKEVQKIIQHLTDLYKLQEAKNENSNP